MRFQRESIKVNPVASFAELQHPPVAFVDNPVAPSVLVIDRAGGPTKRIKAHYTDQRSEMIHSPETLAILSGSDGGFAGIRDPNFCARGSSDGGM